MIFVHKPSLIALTSILRSTALRGQFCLSIRWLLKTGLTVLWHLHLLQPVTETALFTHVNFADLILDSSFRSPQFCDLVVRVFDRRGGRNINFDDFIQACVMLKTLTDKFRVKDVQQNGMIRITYEEVNTCTLYEAHAYLIKSKTTRLRTPYKYCRGDKSNFDLLA